MSQAPVMSLTDEMLEEIKEECDSCIEVRLLGRTGALLVEELRRLRAENAEMAKDAGRYRWLRDESLSCGMTAPAIMVVDEAGNPVFRGNPWNSLLCSDDADSAIDTAMESAQ